MSESINGLLFAKMIIAASNRLNAEKAEVDSLNVFPVPDGDTGTNMSLTMSSAAKFVGRLSEDEMTVAKVAEQMAYGALMGARGNSGVILSQILGGFAKGVENKQELTAKDLCESFLSGMEAAYKAVSKPMEGTILTVSKDAAHYLMSKYSDELTIEEALQLYLEEGYRSLARTPDILPVLKQANVVDAGGKGLLVVVEGMLAGFLGQEDFAFVASEPSVNDFQDDHFAVDPDSIVFKYCTELFVRSANALQDAEEIKAYLQDLGDSMLVVAAGEMIKIHVHTNDPGKVLSFCGALGDLSDMKIENMKLQNAQIIQSKVQNEPMKPIAVIAVSVGEGLNTIFTSMGVDYVVSGGQTMNPSTEDFLEAIDEVNAEEIVILPNNKNIIMTAEQAAKVCEKSKVYVVPSRSIPQGITAMMAYNMEESGAYNADEMKNALQYVRSVEVTYAVRDTSIDDKEIREGQIMGIVDGKIAAVHEDVNTLIENTLDIMDIVDDELVTLYYGEGITEEMANELVAVLEEKYPQIEFESHEGGQAVYYYLLSVE